MGDLHTIGAYTYKVCGDGSVTIASGPSGTAGLTYAAGSEAARDVLAMINQGASEISMMFAVKDADRENAVALGQAFFGI